MTNVAVRRSRSMWFSIIYLTGRPRKDLQGPRPVVDVQPLQGVGRSEAEGSEGREAVVRGFVPDVDLLSRTSSCVRLCKCPPQIAQCGANKLEGYHCTQSGEAFTSIRGSP